MISHIGSITTQRHKVRRASLYTRTVSGQVGIMARVITKTSNGTCAVTNCIQEVGMNGCSPQCNIQYVFLQTPSQEKESSSDGPLLFYTMKVHHAT